MSATRYRVELGGEPKQQVWTCRKAAWAIEDLPALLVRPGEQDVGLIYRQMGRNGLESIENVGPRLGQVIKDLLQQQVSASC